MSLQLLVPFIATSAVLAAPNLPLRVSDVSAGPSPHVRVTNTANQPITAWALAATTRTAGGSHREVYSADGYLSEATHGLPNANPAIERIMPGESRDLPIEGLPAGATVEPFAVVLEDGTALGDEDTLNAIFAKRARERDALKAVVDAFADVLPAKRGADALAALRDRFAALVLRQNELPCRAALDAVQTYQRKTNAEEIDNSLRMYADFVKGEYDLAVRHSRRRAA